jgi:hypothetical protein
MKETLGKGRKDDHDWFSVEIDLVKRGTAVVLKRYDKPGWVCRRCHIFTMLKDDWRSDDPPCQEKGAPTR